MDPLEGLSPQRVAFLSLALLPFPSAGVHMSVRGAGMQAKQAKLLVTFCHFKAKVKEPHSRRELAVLKVRIVKENNSNNHFILMELKEP